MSKHLKKMIAPIIVSVIVIAYYILYFGVIIHYLNGTVFSWIFGGLAVILSVVMIAVCVERIKEIRKGDEDDLSKY